MKTHKYANFIENSKITKCIAFLIKKNWKIKFLTHFTQDFYKKTKKKIFRLRLWSYVIFFSHKLIDITPMEKGHLLSSHEMIDFLMMEIGTIVILASCFYLQRNGYSYIFFKYCIHFIVYYDSTMPIFSVNLKYFWFFSFFNVDAKSF